MIDISDGLSLDLWRLCEASGVGATLTEDLLEHVVSDDTRRAAEDDDQSPLEHVLGDGEDFELLFAASGAVEDIGVPVFPIGTVTESGLLLTRTSGVQEPLAIRGFVH